MELNENNYKEKITAFAKQDWRPLIALIPKIESTSGVFGEMKGGKFVATPWWAMAETISQFLEIVYSLPIIINFNWQAWDEGREMVGRQDFNYGSIDVPTSCKLITALVRNDRLFKGALVAAFESGIISKILKSIEKNNH